MNKNNGEKLPTELPGSPETKNETRLPASPGSPELNKVKKKPEIRAMSKTNRERGRKFDFQRLAAILILSGVILFVVGGSGGGWKNVDMPSFSAGVRENIQQFIEESGDFFGLDIQFPENIPPKTPELPGDTPSPLMPTQTETLAPTVPFAPSETPTATASPTPSETPSPQSTETAAPEAIDYLYMENDLLRTFDPEVKSMDFTRGGSIWYQFQTEAGSIHIIAVSKDADHPEKASMIEGKYHLATTLEDKERIAKGIPLPEGWLLPPEVAALIPKGLEFPGRDTPAPAGTYIYNLDLNAQNATDFHPLNRKINTLENFVVISPKGTFVNLFQLSSDGNPRYDDNDKEHQGENVSIQSLWKLIYGTPTPSPDSNDQTLGPQSQIIESELAELANPRVGQAMSKLLAKDWLKEEKTLRNNS